MAFVPELDDPSKDASAPTDDTSDISTQSSTTNIAAAPSPGGQSAAGGQPPAPSRSSGSFQDFSKFKAANQGKLTALSNLATDQAKGGVDKAKSAFDNAGSAYQSEIQKNAKNWDTSQFKTLGKDNTVDASALGKDLAEASTQVDSGIQQGQLAGSQEFTDLQNKTNQVQNLGTRAGTASVLNDYNTAAGNRASAAASNQDALLLQSMGDYRNQANQVAQATKGADANALAAQQKALADTANKVTVDNDAYKTKALAALGGLQTNLQQDLTDRAGAAEAMRLQGTQQQIAQTKAQATPVLRAKATQDLNDYIKSSANGGWTSDERGAATAAEIKRLQGIVDSSDEDLFNTYNPQLSGAVNQYGLDSNSSKVTEDNIYRDDKARQAQLTALQQLLGGAGSKSYNAGALDPLQSQALTPVQSLLAQIQGQMHAAGPNDLGASAQNAPKDAAAQKYIDDAVKSVTPKTVGTTSGSKTGKATTTKSPILR